LKGILFNIHQFSKHQKDNHEMREKIRKGQLMDLQGLFWIEKIKIQDTDRECKRCNNLEKLYRSYVEKRHQKISEQ
jgi:hypothetical protein